jgi:hypothetical protein
MPLVLPASVQPANLFPVDPGTRLFRNHHRDFGGATFNPCRGGATRFAPLLTPDGACIPTFYAATTFDGAAYETMFRDPPSKYGGYRRQLIEDRGVSVIAPERTLRLVGLFTPELRRLGIPPEEMFQAHDSVYPFCRGLAEMAWRDNPDIDGIVWSSVRDSAARAMLLFGDRLVPADFSVESVRLVETDPTLLDELNETAARCGSFIAR